MGPCTIAGTRLPWRALPELAPHEAALMSWRNKLTPRRLRQLWYAPLLLLAMALMMLRVLVLARLLDVPDFAQLSLGLLVSSTFGMLGCLGLQSLLQRDMPILIVRGRITSALVLLLQSALVAYGCAAVAGLAVAATALPGWVPMAVGVLGIVHGLSQQLFLLVSTESRSHGEPLRFSMQSLVRASLVFGLGTMAAMVTGSALAVLAIEAVASLVLAHGLLARIFRRAERSLVACAMIARQRLTRINWVSALTFLAVSMVGFVLVSADRWAASWLLDTAGFAHYAFAAILLTVAMSLQSLVNSSVYPLLARLYARAGRHAAYLLSLRLSLALLTVGLLSSIPLYYLLDAAIVRWYPAYDPTREILGLLLVVAVLRLADFGSSYLLITGFERQLLRINTLTVLLVSTAWLAWLRPWQGQPPTLQDLAVLALLLSLTTYAVVAATSWRHRKPEISS